MKNYMSKKYTDEEMIRMFKESFGYDYEAPNEDDTLYTEYQLEMIREAQKPKQCKIYFDEKVAFEPLKTTESEGLYVCSSTRWGIVYRGLALQGGVRLPFESRTVSELAKLYPQYWHEVA